MSKAKVTVTMTKSTIATTPAQRETLKGLGLSKRGKTRVLEDTASVRGMIRKVIHLVDVQKGDQAPKKEKKSFFTVKEAKQAAPKKAAKKTSTKKATKKSA